MRDVVRAQKVRKRVVGNDQPDHVEGAEVHEHLVAHRQDPPVLGGGQRDAVNLVTRMRRRGEVFAALFHPAHRPAEFARCEDHQHVLRVLDAFLAEPAADVASDDANALDRLTQRTREDGLQHVRRLGPRPDRERAAERLDRRQDAARLERRGGVAMGTELLLDHDGRGREGLLGSALSRGDRQREVALPARLDQRRARCEGGDRIEHRRKRLVLDLDLLGRIDRRVAALGDDQGDRLPDVGHLRRREQWDRVEAVQRLQLAQQPLGSVDFAGDADRLGAACGVRGSEHRDDARHRPSRRHVDRAERRVRVRTSDEEGRQRSRDLQVGDVPSLPAEEPVVLDAPDRLPDQRRSRRVAGHRQSAPQSAQPSGCSFNPQYRLFWCLYWRMPSRPFSIPRPLSLMPVNGVEIESCL